MPRLLRQSHRCGHRLAFVLGGLLIGTVAHGEPTTWTPRSISTAAYESSPSFTPEGRELFFLRADASFQGYRLLWSTCGRKGWSDPIPPPFAQALPVTEADPFVTADGQRVYFVSSRHGAAQGRGHDDLDIWFADRLPSGEWSAHAERLPEPVNSTASELLPRLTRDGDLYFGSAREGGQGGSDIYVARRGADGAWSVDGVDELNTPNNEYEADTTPDGKTLVLVADRGDRSHLYLYTRPDASSPWSEQRWLPAFASVFQVGPRLSPSGDRVLFAQADGARSGELFLLDLSSAPDPSWPPSCPR